MEHAQKSSSYSDSPPPFSPRSISSSSSNTMHLEPNNDKRHLSMQSQLSDQSNEEPKSPLHGGDRASYTPLLLAPPKPNEPLMSGSEMRSFILGDGTYQKSRERWDPIPFRLWFGMLLVLGMIFLAVGVEILLFLSKLNNGFNNSLIRAGNTKGIHFFYTAVVVALSLPVVAAFGYLDYCIKSVQPYIDLDKGTASADRSVLLNYTADNNFFVLLPALKRKHWLTFLSTCMCIVTLVISPLSAALFLVAPVNLPVSNHTAQSTTQLGFLDDPNFKSFASASGFALAQVIYDAAWPPFVNQDGAISEFTILPGWGKNGTVVANTVAVNVTANCIPVSATKSPGAVTIDSPCDITLNVVDSPSHQLGIYCVNCGTLSPQMRPVAFISFTSSSVEAVVCTPTIQVLNVKASIALDSGILSTVATGVVPNSENPLQNPPLNGAAFNGIAAANSNAPDVSGRLGATLTNLATAVAYSPGSLADAANSVYGVYLNVLALSVYYVPVQNDIPVELHLVQPRLSISSFVAHILAVVFSFLAIAAAFLTYFHRRARSNVFLPASPGTIATACSVAGGSELAHLIEPRDDRKTCSKLLRRHKFTLDHNGRITVVQTSSQYGSNKSKRTSFFEE